MAKLNAFFDKNATQVTESDIKGLRNMMNNAQTKAKEDANKTQTDFNEGLKYTSLPANNEVSQLNQTQSKSVPSLKKTQDLIPANQVQNNYSFTNANPEVKNANTISTNVNIYNYANKDRLSKEEKKVAKQEYKALKKYGIEQNTENQRKKWKEAIESGEVPLDYANAVQNAYYKSSLEGAALSGVASFGSTVAEPIYLGGAIGEKAINKATGRNNTDWQEANQNRKEVVSEFTKAHPLASTAGAFTGKAVQYGVANNLLSKVPVLDKGKTAMAKSLSAGKAGEMLTDVTFDMIPDIALDTIPTEVDNALNGMSAKDIAKDTAKNLATNYVFNLGAGAFQYGKQISDELSDASKANADAIKARNEAIKAAEEAKVTEQISNNLANDWLSLDKDAIGNAYVDNSRKVIVDRLRAENPALLGGLSDEDVFQYYLKTNDNMSAQNYSNMYNVLNNTDNSVPSLKPTGVENTTGLDLMNNQSDIYDAIQNFKNTNPAAQYMTDRDIKLFLESTENQGKIDRNNSGIMDLLKNTDEVTSVKDSNIDTNTMLREAGLEDYIPTEGTYTKPLSAEEQFASLKEGSAMKGVAKDYTDTKSANSIKFENEADKKQFKKSLDDFYKAVDDLDNVTSKEELDAIKQNINNAYRNLNETISKGGYIDNSAKEVNRNLRKKLFDALEGTKIYVDDLSRAELKDYRTIREMNNKFGKNIFTANPNTEGAIEIDKMWGQLDLLSGGQLGEMPSNNGDAMAQLIELSQNLKSSSKVNNFVNSGLKTSDIVSNDLRDELREVIGAYEEHFANNPIKEVADTVDDVAEYTPTLADLVDNTDLEEVSNYIVNRQNLIEAAQTTKDVNDNVQILKSIMGMDEYMNQKYPEYFENGAFVGKPQKNVVMAEDIGINPKTTIEPNVVEDSFELPGNIEEAKSIIDNTPVKTVEEGPVGVSKFYSNSLRRSVEPDEFKQYYKTQDYLYNKKSNNDLIERAADNLDMRGIDNSIKRLVNLEKFYAEDVAEAALIRQYLSDNGYAEESAKLMQRIRPVMSTETAQALQAHKLFSKNTVEGAFDEALISIDKAIDAKHLTNGYSSAVNKLVNKVTDALKEGNVEGAKKLLDGKLGDYAPRNNKWRNDVKNIKIPGQESIEFIDEAIANGRNVEDIANELGTFLKGELGGNTLSDAQQSEVLNMLKQAYDLPKNDYQRKELMARAAKMIQNELPSKLSYKVKSMLYANMLGNFKTALTRNLGGNLVGNTLEILQKPVRTGLDALIGNKTGVRNYDMGGGITKEGAKGFKKGLTEQLSDIRNGIDTTRSGQDSIADAINEARLPFKLTGEGKEYGKKIGNKYSQLVTQVMKIGDRPIYEAQYAAAKKELENLVDKGYQLQRAGVPDSVADEELIEFWATNRALDAVYQKGTLSSSGFTKIKQGLGEIAKDTLGVDLLSQSTSPFVQVPANLISRGADYTPIGLIKNLITTGGELRTKNFNQKRFVDQTTRNLTGLALTGGSVALANKGFSTGEKSENNAQKAAQNNAGELEFALKLPNGRQYDISDIPVLGGKVQSAAAIVDALNENANEEDRTVLEKLKTTKEKGKLADLLVTAAKQDAEAQFGTSTTQGYNRLLGANRTYDNGAGIIDNATDTIRSAGTQLIFALLRQTAAFNDPYKRNLGEYGTREYYLNSIKNTIPGEMFGFGRESLPIKTDEQGLPILQNQGRGIVEKALENYLLPYTISEPNYYGSTEEANKLYEKLGSDAYSAYASNFSRNDVREILGDNYSEEGFLEVSQAQKDIDRELCNELINSEGYQELTDFGKVKALSNLHNASKAIVKMQNDMEQENAIADAYMNGGENAIADAVNMSLEKADNSVVSKQLRDLGLPVNNQTKAIIDSPSAQAEYKTALEEASKYGLDKISEKMWNEYRSGDKEGFKHEIVMSTLSDKYDLPISQISEEWSKGGGEKSIEKLKHDYDIITKIEVGTDEYGEKEYLSCNDKTRQILSNSGVDGLKRYADTVKMLDRNDIKKTDKNVEFAMTHNASQTMTYQEIITDGTKYEEIIPIMKDMNLSVDDAYMYLSTIKNGDFAKAAGTTKESIVKYYYDKY